MKATKQSKEVICDMIMKESSPLEEAFNVKQFVEEGTELKKEREKKGAMVTRSSKESAGLGNNRKS